MWVPEGARCTGALLHVFSHVICTRCYEMHVFYVGPGRDAVHGVSFACVFTCNLHTLLRNACILCGGSLLHVFLRIICARYCELRVLYVGPGRSVVHRVSFACVFTYNLHTLLRNACILPGSRKERSARSLLHVFLRGPGPLGAKLLLFYVSRVPGKADFVAIYVMLALYLSALT